jgi:hypothetical protein
MLSVVSVLFITCDNAYQTQLCFSKGSMAVYLYRCCYWQVDPRPYRHKNLISFHIAVEDFITLTKMKHHHLDFVIDRLSEMQGESTFLQNRARILYLISTSNSRIC